MKRLLQTGVLLVLAAALLNACADPQAFLPKPYRPADKGQNRMAPIVLPDHIVVPPVRGLAPQMSALFTRAMIDALLQVEYIATSTSPPQQTSRLYGKYTPAQDGTGSLRLTFLDPWGAILEDFSVLLEIDIAQLDPAAYEAHTLARNLAQTVAARLETRQSTPVVVRSLLSPTPAAISQTAAPGMQANTAPTGEAIIVTAIFDAPEQGARHLRKAIEASLRAAGFAITARPGPQTYRLQCTVGVTESRTGFQHLALSWELKSPQDEVLATIDQANEIPVGSLKEGWAQLAPLVTQGAATGISNYFAKAAQTP